MLVRGNIVAKILFVDFSKAFDSIHRGKMDQILFNQRPTPQKIKKTVAATMMLYKKTKVKVHSPDGDTDYLDIVTSVLQGDTLTPNLFIICVDNVLRTSIDIMKGNGFKLTKEKSRRYPAQTITNTDYADDIALLANTPTQAETLLLYHLERAAVCIGHYINANKTKYKCFNQRGDISTLNGISLKLVDQFTNLGSSVSSTEAWAAIDRLSVIWKSDLTDKIKTVFSQISHVDTAIRMHYMDAS